MELNNLEKHFIGLVDKAMPPSVIRNKMNLTTDEYIIMCDVYSKYKTFKHEQRNNLETQVQSDLNSMWSQIEDLCTEFKIETDYERRCILEHKIESLAIKYSETLLHEIKKEEN